MQKQEKIIDFSLEGKKTANDFVQGLAGVGFQAGHLAEAVELIEKMKKEKATIFFGFTANLVASGLRGIIAEMCKKKFVDVVVTTAGAIDHDIIKTFQPYLKGSFNLDDIGLHKKGINRLGNILVPNKRFELLEEKTQAWFKEIFARQKTISPSALAKFFGEKLDETSFLYWCAKNQIPVFCPGITDGAIGLQMYFFKQDHKDFVVDVTGDMKQLADIVLNAEKTGAIVLGGGISKHHIIGSNIVREGLDFAVYVCTAGEFDGSLSGAQTREAKSWGKIKEEANSINVNCDATIAFPLMAAALKDKKLL